MVAGILLSVFASPALADDAADKETRRFAGTWKFVSLTSDGDQAPQEFLQSARWFIQGKTITLPGPKEGKITFEVDPSRSPKTIDMTSAEGSGKAAEGIYKLEGERLTICLPGGKKDVPGKPRPGEFSGGEGMSLVILERIKKE